MLECSPCGGNSSERRQISIAIQQLTHLDNLRGPGFAEAKHAGEGPEKFALCR